MKNICTYLNSGNVKYQVAALVVVILGVGLLAGFSERSRIDDLAPLAEGEAKAGLIIIQP